MCGIAGYLADDPREGLAAAVAAMTQTLQHRGPDRQDVWAEGRIALGHRRLSIVDLSDAAAQPMASADGRWVMTYNGELYNAPELRAALPTRNWRTHSDTEALVEAVAEWGVEAAAKAANGMFTAALWDRREQVLWLLRDRLGIKPLFFGRCGEGWAFGSELKALHAAPGFVAEIDEEAAAGYLRFAYVPGGRSIWRGVQALGPGEIARIEGAQVQRSVYWSARDTAAAARAAPFAGDDAAAVDALEALLRDAVERQMVADVPVGVFLSGGVDSSTVAALMQAVAPGRVRSFSIGFDEAGYDESAHAAAVAAHLGADHTKLTARGADALALIPELPEFYDEPFADSSQIPTLLLSRLTRAHVTVALSGDGGDELFMGYNRHIFAARHGARFGAAPWLGRLLRASPTPLLDALGRRLPGAPPQLGLKLRKLGEALSFSAAEAHRRLASQMDDALLRPGPTTAFDDPAFTGFGSAAEAMALTDAVTYLPGDILTKVDRASMAASLEARPPLLDHRVFAFAWSLPQAMKVREGRGKWALRQVLYRHVPAALIDRPKQGFGIPLAAWLRGPLKDWAADLLNPQQMRAPIDATAVNRLWAAHAAGRADHAYALWTVLMFEAWARRWA